MNADYDLEEWLLEYSARIIRLVERLLGVVSQNCLSTGHFLAKAPEGWRSPRRWRARPRAR